MNVEQVGKEMDIEVYAARPKEGCVIFLKHLHGLSDNWQQCFSTLTMDVKTHKYQACPQIHQNLLFCTWVGLESNEQDRKVHENKTSVFTCFPKAGELSCLPGLLGWNFALAIPTVECFQSHAGFCLPSV